MGFMSGKELIDWLEARKEGERQGREKGYEEGLCQGLLEGIACALAVQFGRSGRKLARKAHALEYPESLRLFMRFIMTAQTLKEVREYLESELPKD